MTNGRAGDWNHDGVILFAAQAQGAVRRIPATGGEPVAATAFAAEQGSAHNSPHFLPDGRHFLFGDRGGIFVGQLGELTARHLLDANTVPRYVRTGHLMFVRQGTLYAQKFDSVRLELNGDPFPVADQVSTDSNKNAALSVSAAGSIAYRVSPTAQPVHQFVWFDRSGKEIEKVGAPGSGNQPSMSWDGRRLATSRDGDIWILDIARGLLSRFTFRQALERYPI